MCSPSFNAYARLRRDLRRTDALCEGRDAPAEELLQAIWQHQRLHRNKIRTVSGQPVFILHPGFLNREPGPDFRDAVVQVGSGAPQTGDIEVDPSPADWLHHKHQINPAYGNVVLHVVWRLLGRPSGPAGLPTVELAPFLDSPVESLTVGLRHPTLETPRSVTGKCAASLRDSRPDQIERLLREAALFRLRSRAEHLQAHAREAGWTQVLWEGIFRALGYKHNTWPMLRLAELRPRWETPNARPVELCARLLGLSGLLPWDSGSKRSPGSDYLRRLWDCWWRERDQFADCLLPPNAWRLAGLRPANHPQRRLALAAHWISRGDFPDRLRAWCQASCKDSQLPHSLGSVLQSGADPFWSRHHSLRSRTSPVPVPLLGRDRVTDLAVNVVLPWLWARAHQGRRLKTCREMERRYLAWPSGPDNAVLRMARRRLFEGRGMNLSPRASLQQGLLQIVRDHCNHSNSLCDRCRFPEIARCFTAP